jgi:hypothetical protein
LSEVGVGRDTTQRLVAHPLRRQPADTSAIANVLFGDHMMILLDESVATWAGGVPEE